MQIKPLQIEDRLINFAVLCIKISESIGKSNAGQHLSNQLVGSATSPAPNYGEAQSVESRKDFVHKLKIASKELRETHVCLKIIARSNMSENPSLLKKTILENNELITIFTSSVNTAKKNMQLENRQRS